MLLRPLLRYAGIYVAAELAAAALLIWALGLGWALVVLAVTFLVGVLLAAGQVKGQIAAVRRARRDPQGAVADGVLVGVGSLLVFLPGIVSTAVGALMLAPPTRTAMRPVAAAMLTRGVYRRVEALDLDQFMAARPGRRDYIDGEVIDVEFPGAAARPLPSRR